ncbi:glycerate kinase family protein [Ruminococcus flavefaciens]|uniref:Glycerate kinase n=1 Tax=Ruminococcus flavefaciens TaxID=1265 RepID=A0A1M7KG17_RUMFL|nr:glycerate kinase [Ruminococcus flavefaciens]SHM64172.1 glycerate kinase [Ruminococcus flavefaciens]
MQKAVIAIDSFKGSLSSLDAGKAAAEGIYRVFPEADAVIRPVADGGEGTVEALVSGLNGKFMEAQVRDPLGRRITAKYGILPDNTAVIEMAAASGLTLLSEAERDPMHTTTYGTGEMILDAIHRGCRSFIIGIGGSATNDGGIGCLQALGFGMLDNAGKQVEYGAKGLSELVRITDNNVIPELKECSFHVACDVTNPLCGINGCSEVFAPQKGADKNSIRLMDEYLRSYAEIAKCYAPSASPNTAGSGAAGGLGFAMMYFLNAELQSGVELVIRETRLEEAIKTADIVITGEGCLDSQTCMGKAPVGIAGIAKKYGKPVIAFSGAVRRGAELCNSSGIDAYFPILRSVCTLEQAMDKENAYKNLADTAEQVFRTIRLSGMLTKNK